MLKLVEALDDQTNHLCLEGEARMDGGTQGEVHCIHITEGEAQMDSGTQGEVHSTHITEGEAWMDSGTQGEVHSQMRMQKSTQLNVCLKRTDQP